MANVAREERQVLLLCFLTDLLIFSIGLHAASLAVLDTLPFVDVFDLQRDRTICILIFAVALLLSGSYNPWRITDRFDAMYYLLLALGGAATAYLALATLAPAGVRVISRREMVFGVAISAPLLVVWRYWAARLTARFSSLHRLFYVLGPESEARHVAEAIQRDASFCAEARYITLDVLKEQHRQRSQQDVHRLPIIPEDAIIAAPGMGGSALDELLEFCEAHCRRTFLYPSLHDILLAGRMNLLALAGVPLVEIAGQGVSSPYIFVKRFMDVACAFAGLVLASPLCAATAIAIRLTSHGPILYSQERMGLNGRVFRLHKFRSMVTDAERQTGPVWAAANDTRVTPLGRFIRKHRIDEIPQLWNVLKGDMSLVGPRPERPHFHQEFCAKWPLFERRLRVRPGVTSLSHVLGSYSSEPHDRLRYDLIYITSVSLVTDLKILLQTVRIVLGGKGAQ